MQKLKVGVAGVGHLGKLHASLYKQVAAAELVGIYDLDAERAQAVAGEFGCDVFSSFEALVESVQALNIVAPTTHHFALAEKALAVGKHLFIEKPIATTVAEADALIRLAGEKKCKIQVGHIERFNQAMRALRSIQVAPMFIESHRLASFDPRGTDVAVVLDLMIHDLDIILSLVNSPVKSIDANGVAVVSAEPDIANARIKFENGCVANVTASRISQKKMRKMRLFERDAYVSIDLLQGISERFKLETELPDAEARRGIVMGKMEGQKTAYVFYERLSALEGNALLMELETFAHAILHDEQPPVTAEDGRKALAVASEIAEIIRGQEVG
ncbi:MAG: Gfo/Idh/MocA family protein [bacterium]